MARPIRILGTGSFLPGPAVLPDRIEEVLGAVPGLSPRLASRVERLGAEVRARSGIRGRHFAIDPASRLQTETSASMAEKAVRAALEAAGVDAASLDLLVAAVPVPDGVCPPTSAMVQGRLKVERMTEIEIHSNCTGTPKALQVALDALRTGRYRRAAVVAAQLASVLLRGEWFNGAKAGLESLALRWIMSDGAGAVVLDGAGDPEQGPALLEAHVTGAGGLREPGMVGAALGSFAADTVPDGRSMLAALYETGRHHLSQDLSSVARDAPRDFADGLVEMVEAHGLVPADVPHWLLAVPGLHFVTGETEARLRSRLGDVPDRAARDIAEFGYCGGATPFVQLDRLARGGAWRRGDVVVAYVEESSKWMSGGFVARG